MTSKNPRTAILIPCLNEEKNIQRVISDCSLYVPEADVFVCDNGSTDGTGTIASQAGVKVLFESERGKGAALRRLFQEVEADFYVMIDGDDTYDISSIPMMLNHLQQGDDAVFGIRDYRNADTSLLRKMGNRFFSALTNILNNGNLSDALCGYRAFTKAYISSFPHISSGFEIETELNIYTLSRKLKYSEVTIARKSDRKNDINSKLRIFRDGQCILVAIFVFSWKYRMRLRTL